MKSMIRWPGLGIFAASLVTICLFNLFFIDSIIESLIEDQGTRLNGARVELEKADFSFFPTGLELRGLQVTNSDDPMQNLVAIDRIAASIDPLKLLQRKIIIEEMAVEGIRPNRPRQTSGAISKKTSTTNRGDSEKEKEKEQTTTAPKLKIPDAKEVLAKEELNTITLTKEYQEQFKADKAIWQQRVNDLPDKEKLSNYKKRIEQLSSGGIRSVLKNADKLKSLEKEIKSDVKLVKNAQKDIDQLAASYKERLAKLKKAPQQDIDRLTDKYALSGTGLANMSSIIFGTGVGDTIKQALSWYAQAQPMIERAKANSSSEDSVKVARGKGVDVRFQEQNPLPDFLIRNVTASVVIDQGTLTGTILSITPDQDVIGVPTTFQFQGESLQGVGGITIDGILDHIDQSNASDSIKVVISDFTLQKSVSSADQGSMPSLSNGLLSLSAQANIREENIAARIDAEVTSATFTTTAAEQSDSLSRAIDNAMSNVTEFSGNAEITGTLDNYKVKLQSDLDKILQQAAAESLKAETAKFKNNLKILVMEQTKKTMEQTESELGWIDSFSNDLRDRVKIGENLL